jgi:hypothetical protein
MAWSPSSGNEDYAGVARRRALEQMMAQRMPMANRMADMKDRLMREQMYKPSTGGEMFKRTANLDGSQVQDWRNRQGGRPRQHDPRIGPGDSRSQYLRGR